MKQKEKSFVIQKPSENAGEQGKNHYLKNINMQTNVHQRKRGIFFFFFEYSMTEEWRSHNEVGF